MSYTNEQWRVAITNLLTKTSSNELRWTTSDLFEGDAWTNIDSSLETDIGERKYVISQTRTKYYHDEDVFTWTGGFNFSIFENTGFNGYQKIATAPDLSALTGLFEAAESNMAFNRNALDGLL